MRFGVGNIPLACCAALFVAPQITAAQNAPQPSCSWSFDWTSRSGQYRIARTTPLSVAGGAGGEPLRLMAMGSSGGDRHLVLGMPGEGQDSPASGELALMLRGERTLRLNRARVEDLPNCLGDGDGPCSLWFYGLSAAEWAILGRHALLEMALTTADGNRLMHVPQGTASRIMDLLGCVDATFPLVSVTTSASPASASETDEAAPRTVKDGNGPLPRVSKSRVESKPLIAGESSAQTLSTEPKDESVVAAPTTIPAPSGRGMEQGDAVCEGFRYKHVSEDPSRFNALAVYTVLHIFSDPAILDTFRVVTTIAANGGMRHELRVSTAGGRTYRKALLPAPLLEGSANSARISPEMELLRVRMALAPGAFVPEPISVNAWRLSDEREARDLIYDLSKAEFTELMAERPAVGLRFRIDEQVEEVLVYARGLDRIVNINPQ